MKKVLTIALIGTLLYCLTGCTPMRPDRTYHDKPAGIVGNWKCSDMNQVTGMLFDFADALSGLDVFGTLSKNTDISIYLTFSQNGTYQLDATAMMLIVGTQTETITGTYSWQNNELVIDGEVIDASLQGNKLTLTSHTPDGYVVRLEFERAE